MGSLLSPSPAGGGLGWGQTARAGPNGVAPIPAFPQKGKEQDRKLLSASWGGLPKILAAQAARGAVLADHAFTQRRQGRALVDAREVVDEAGDQGIPRGDH